MTKETPVITKQKAIEIAEEALGNNLVWLTDQLDWQVRRKDKETLRRLAELNDAWILLALVK